MLSFQAEHRLSPALGCRFLLYPVYSSTTWLGVTMAGSDPRASGNSQMCGDPGKQELEIFPAEKQESGEHAGSTMRRPLTGECPSDPPGFPGSGVTVAVVEPLRISTHLTKCEPHGAWRYAHLWTAHLTGDSTKPLWPASWISRADRDQHRWHGIFEGNHLQDALPQVWNMQPSSGKFLRGARAVHDCHGVHRQYLVKLKS